MADSKLSGLSATTTPLSTDIFYIVTDPDGTPTSNKVTGVNMGKALTLVGKVTVTQPASSAVLTLTDGKTLAVTNTLTLSGTDSTVMTFPAASDTVAGLGTLNIFTVAQTMRKNSTDAVGAILNYKKARGTGTTIIVTGDTLGSDDFYGYDGSNDLLMGQIACLSTGTIASTRVPTQIVFKTATNAAPSVLTTAMTIGADQAITHVAACYGPVGTASVPTYSFTSEPTSGLYRISSNNVGIAVNSTSVASFSVSGIAAAGFGITGTTVSLAGGIRLQGGVGFVKWTNGDVNTDDLGIYRNAAGVLEVDSGTAGTFRDLKLRNLLVQSGGSVDVSAIAAGSPNFVITKTTDTPTTTFNVVGTANPSAAPSGFIEITEGGGSKYIPFYA